MMLEKLKQYKEQYGSCTVPGQDGTLGGWVKYQRYRYWMKRVDNEQIDALLLLDDFKFRLQH